MSRFWAFTRAAALLGLAIAAGCGEENNTQDGGMSCAELFQSCEMGGSCCTGICDPASKTCIAPECGAAGTSCTGGTDCCTLHCGTDGKCSDTLCKQKGSSCTDNNECCSQNCAEDNTCQPVNTVSGACVTDFEACAGNGDCCSKNCKNNVCEPTGGPCNPDGNVCLKNEDCCSNLCQIAEGAYAGTCATVNASGSGSCTQDNQPCEGSCTNCCSRVCTPTLTGGYICAAASGCRMAGAICHQDSDCCGGADGKVTCNFIDETQTVGTCGNPNGCNPQGNSCGLKSGSTTVCGNGRQDCCGCTSMPGGPSSCCRLDNAGVPRCFGPAEGCPNGYTGVAPCCIAAGDTCTFSAECCNGAACVPESEGSTVLKCGTACSESGGACRANGDCCAGLSCIIEPGQIDGTCGAGAASCSSVGQACSTTQPCCNDLKCFSVSDNTVCADGMTNCTCVVPPPG